MNSTSIFNMCKQSAKPPSHHNGGLSFYEEMKEQMKMAWPTLCGMLLYKIPWLISPRFVGALGAEELASAALATTLCNVTGLSLSVGLSSAMTTLTGQARGDLIYKSRKMEDRQPLLINANNNKKANYSSATSIHNGDATTQGRNTKSSKPKALLPMVFLYRGLVIQMLFVIPVGIWWLSGIRPLLLALGQNPTISEMTSMYLRILMPGLWSYSVSWTITTWVQSIEMADVPAYAAGVSLASHIPFNYFFIYYFDWGCLGCAVTYRRAARTRARTQRHPTTTKTTQQSSGSSDDA